MVSAAIAAALFLLVLLLIEGWRLSPIGAAIVVSVMPLAALARRRLGAGAGSAAPAPRPARSSSPAGSAAWRCCPRPRSR
jgi:Na+-transporting methylmalonyl-CoA/oxaloacetate decarboxylase gamma subunit